MISIIAGSNMKMHFFILFSALQEEEIISDNVCDLTSVDAVMLQAPEMFVFKVWNSIIKLSSFEYNKIRFRERNFGDFNMAALIKEAKFTP